MIPRLLGLARNDFVLDVVYFLVLTTYSLVLLIDTEMKKVTFKSRENAEKKNPKRYYWYIRYLVVLHKIIRDNTYLLYMNKEVKNSFLLGLMVSFRSACKSSSYLARAKLYPLHGRVGSEKCAKSCYEICDYVTDTDIFTNIATG